MPWQPHGPEHCVPLRMCLGNATAWLKPQPCQQRLHPVAPRWQEAPVRGGYGTGAALAPGTARLTMQRGQAGEPAGEGAALGAAGAVGILGAGVPAWRVGARWGAGGAGTGFRWGQQQNVRDRQWLSCQPCQTWQIPPR